MPPPTLLIFRRTPPIQVYEQAPTFAITQDGSDVPSASTRDAPVGATALARSKVGNAVCEAFGRRYLSYNNTVRERDEGGSGNWGIVYTFASAINDNLHSGLVVCHANGQEVLACMYNPTTTDNINVVFTTDGNNWTEVEAVNPASGTFTTYGTVRAFRAQITWAVNHASGNLFTYDFETGVGAVVVRTGQTAGALSQATHVHKNKFFMLTGGNDFPAHYVVKRLEGGSWTEVYRSTGGAGDADVRKGSPVVIDKVGPTMFTDPVTGDLIIIVQVGHSSTTDQGVVARRILNADTNTNLTEGADLGGQILDISFAVLPVGFRQGDGLPAEGRWFDIYVDNVTTPSSPVVYWLDTTGPAAQNLAPQDQGLATDWYQWNGVGSVMTFVATANTTGADWSIPTLTRGGGERVKTSPAGRPVWDGGILLTHGAVTSGPFLVDDVLTGTSGTAVVRTVYSGSLDVEITSGTFSNTESISGAPSGASATLTADSSDLGSPTEIPGGTTKVYFRVQGSGIAINLEVRLSTSEDVPSTLMNLAAATVTIEAGIPASVPTNTTTQISNVTPDGGSTIYSIELNTTAAGIGAGQGYAVMLVPV